MTLLMPLLLATLLSGTPVPAAPGASATLAPVPTLMELQCAP